MATLEEKTKIGFVLPADLCHWLRVRASQKGITNSNFVRMVLEQQRKIIEQDPKKPRRKP